MRNEKEEEEGVGTNAAGKEKANVSNPSPGRHLANNGLLLLKTHTGKNALYTLRVFV